MTRAAVAVLLMSLFVGCREEPTIVIKFEPNDMAGAAKKPAADMVVAAATANRADLAVPVVETTTKKMKKAPEKKERAAGECKVAADCVIEPLDCCDCANGGKQHAIAKKAAAASQAARADRCKGKMCTMMLSTDPSCGQRPDCVDGACVMAAGKK